MDIKFRNREIVRKAMLEEWPPIEIAAYYQLTVTTVRLIIERAQMNQDWPVEFRIDPELLTPFFPRLAA